jgi:hypothetical protein
LPELWLALKSPLPVLESLSSDLLPDCALFSGLGQDEGLAQNLGVAVNLDAEEAENGRLRLALLDRKRQRDESKNSESRAIEARRVRLLVERQQLISEMEALDAADDATAPETEVVALRKQVKSLSSLLASSGSSAGAHTALAGAGAGAVHPWVKHVQYSGLHAVSASTSAALSAHLKDNPGGHNRGELVPELDKVKSWPAGFSREVHAVTQRPFPPQVIKDFVGGRYNLTFIGYFLPFGLESRDRSLQDYSDRPLAVDVFQSLIDGDGGDISGLRAKSSGSSAALQPANLLDFATAVDAFGRLLYLLRSSEESCSFQRFFPVFRGLLTSFPLVPVATFVSLWSSYVQETMRLVYEVTFNGVLANRYDWDSSERISSLKFRVEMANEQARAARVLRLQQDAQQKDRQKKMDGDTARAAAKALARAQAWQRNGDDFIPGTGGRGGNGSGRGNGGGRGGRGTGGGRGDGAARLQSVTDSVEASDSAANPPSPDVSGATVKMCRWKERCYHINNGCTFRHS